MQNIIIAILILKMTLPILTIEIPEFLHVCSKNNPNMESCVVESVEALKPYLKQGVPEYNIPSLEPLLLKELVAIQGTGIRITANNVHAYGASDFNVRALKVDLAQLHIAVDVDLPHLYITGQYNINGRVLLLPIQGSGMMLGNFTKCTGVVRIKGSKFKDTNNEEHVEITEFRMKIFIGNGVLNLENLFGGERVLGDIINSAINNNFELFIRDVQPSVEKALSDAFLEIANSIVRQFTFNQLFP